MGFVALRQQRLRDLCHPSQRQAAASVFVSDSISLPLYRALATISGGEPVEAP
jgi:hypothetical protein